MAEDEHRAIYKRCDPKKGDVLLVKDGVNTGDAAVNTLDEEFSLLSSVCLLRPRPELLFSQFLRYYLLSPVGYRMVTGQMTGTAIKRIILGRIKESPVPIAPLNEQRTIVAEIEKQFSRLDEAVANLKRIKANLKHYKASVLKAAVEGKLTEDWRKQHPNVEPASKLLERILAERRVRWTGRGQYKDPIAPDTARPPFLPKGYTWATFGQLCRVQGGFAFKSSDYVKRGVPLIRISNLVNGRVQITEDTVFLPEGFAKKFPDFCLRKGDVLIAMSGATTGKMATMPEDFMALLNQRVGRFELSSATLWNAKFISYLVMQISQKVLKDAYGAAQPNISPSEIEAMSVPLPPLLEQQYIVAEVERRLSVIEELEAAVETNLTRADRLRQTVLNKAFMGTLITGL